MPVTATPSSAVSVRLTTTPRPSAPFRSQAPMSGSIAACSGPSGSEGKLTPSPHPEELAKQASRRMKAARGASWFETALARLLTMRDLQARHRERGQPRDVSALLKRPHGIDQRLHVVTRIQACRHRAKL